MNYKLFEYDTSKFQFKKVVKDIMGADCLEESHKNFKFTKKLETMSDQNTILHERFYQGMKQSIFSELYKKFIKEFISKMFDEPVLYQTFPTFRVHQPNNVAVGEFHKDSDFGHDTNEVNFWLPFTNAYDSNTVWIEDPKTKEIECMNVEYGNVARFDGANLNHGNKTNKTGQTRMSIDFRIFAVSHYNSDIQENMTTLAQKKKLIIGDYWSEI
tara:strand:+ start:408 stop:1049 length:642 start_codon:yes stop_codon:yes gene_type:complete